MQKKLVFLSGSWETLEKPRPQCSLIELFVEVRIYTCPHEENVFEREKQQRKGIMN